MYSEPVNSCLFWIAAATLLLIFFLKALFLAFLFLLAGEQQHFFPEEEPEEPNNEEPLLPDLLVPDEELEDPSVNQLKSSLMISCNKVEIPPLALPSKSCKISPIKLPPELSVPEDVDVDDDESPNNEARAPSAIPKIFRNNPVPDPDPDEPLKIFLMALDAKLKIPCNKLDPTPEEEVEPELESELEPSKKLPIAFSATERILSIKLSPESVDVSVPLLNNDSMACSAIESAP